MNAPATDTRSIGQVLYETLYPREKGYADWWTLPPATHERWERDAEPLYKRGFDAGQANPKAPTPKAKAYRDALKETVRALKAAQHEVASYRAGLLIHGNPIASEVAARRSIDTDRRATILAVEAVLK